MKLCAIVVWYNPDIDSDNCIENIKTYSSIVDKTIIVDNSNYSNVMLASKLKNVTYIPLMKNEGIAKALNIGCAIATETGFDWAITMDQDSKWESNIFLEFIKFTDNLINLNDKIVSIAPSPDLPIESLQGKFKSLVKKIMKYELAKPDYFYTDRVICSSNIIKLEKWSEINGFNESLFIDEVDFDFCYRLRIKGYSIVQINRIKFNHVIGTSKKTILEKEDNHSDFRLYYIFRNSLFIMKQYPVYAKKYKYMKRVIRIFIEKFFSIKCFTNIKILKKAIRDSRELQLSKFYQ